MLIFSTAYWPFVGGAEIAIREITDRLADRYDFEMLTAYLDAEGPSQERVGNVLVHRLGVRHLSKIWMAFLGFFKILQLGRSRFDKSNRGSSIPTKSESGFDLFWCVQVSYASGPAYIYNILKFWKKVPIVLTLQEGDSEEHLTKRHFGLIDLSWRLALTRTSVVTAISHYLKERALKLGYKRQIHIIPNGFSDAFLNVQKQEHQSTVLITTSRLVEKNAVGDIIEALNFLPESVKLLVVGDGYLRSDLENLVRRSDLGDRVKFVGFVDNKELPALLGQADIFIRPSLSEGLGISFLEAMAAGLPVIATRVGGIPDFLQDRVTGLFCEINNPESIAQKVVELIDRPELREKIVKNARELVRSKFAWQSIASKMSEVFNGQIT